MFGLGDDSEDDQKFWNLVMFKVYATDEELIDAAPWALLIVVVIVIIFLIPIFI